MSLTVELETDLTFQCVHPANLLTLPHSPQGSFVETLLKNNINPDFRKLADGAQKVSSIDEGIGRVRDGLFVFMDETPFLSYNLIGECDIFYVGGEIQSFNYAFGLPKHSPYAALMNAQMIKLREHGFFEDLWELWDKESDTLGCKGAGTTGKDDTLDMMTLKGIFFFLCFGSGISFILVVLELVWATASDQGEDKHTTFRAKLSRRLSLKMLEGRWLRGRRRSAEREAEDTPLSNTHI